MIIRLMILGAITKDRMRKGLNNNADAQEVEIQWYKGGTQMREGPISLPIGEIAGR